MIGFRTHQRFDPTFKTRSHLLMGQVLKINHTISDKSAASVSILLNSNTITEQKFINASSWNLMFTTNHR
jgi:hypothetical protein